MSYDLNVYVKRAAMPAAGRWKEAVRDNGFSVDLDADFDIDSFSGFLPCPVDGEQAGFEYYSGPLSAEEAAELALPAGVDFSVQFCCGRDPLESIAALAVASTLAQLTGGVLHDPQSDESWLADRAVANAKNEIERLREE